MYDMINGILLEYLTSVTDSNQQIPIEEKLN